jgi:poly(A) polymerase
MQPSFERRLGQSPFSLLDQPRFRAGFDFLRLRAEVGELDVTLADWWQEFQQVDDAAREDLIRQAREEQQRSQQAQRVQAPQGKTHRLPAAPDGDGFSSDAAPSNDDAPRKRRRRRRKPGGAGAPDATN